MLLERNAFDSIAFFSQCTAYFSQSKPSIETVNEKTSSSSSNMAALSEPGLTCVVFRLDYICNINKVLTNKITYVLIFSIHN